MAQVGGQRPRAGNASALMVQQPSSPYSSALPSGSTVLHGGHGSWEGPALGPLASGKPYLRDLQGAGLSLPGPRSVSCLRLPLWP